MLKVGQDIEARFIGVDRKTRTITLSIKAKEMHEEAEAVQSYRSEQGSSSGHEPWRPAEGADRQDDDGDQSGWTGQDDHRSNTE